MKKYISFVSIVIIPFLVTYLYNFGTQNISKSPFDWAAFSSYMGLAVSLCSLGMFIYLTTQIHEYNKNNDKPIISFVTSENSGYSMSNIGKGAAINCRLIYMQDKSEKWHFYKIHHIIANSQIVVLPDSIPVKRIFCFYNDNIGNKFLSIVEDDMLEIHDLNKAENIARLKTMQTWEDNSAIFVHFPNPIF